MCLLVGESGETCRGEWGEVGNCLYFCVYKKQLEKVLLRKKHNCIFSFLKAGYRILKTSKNKNLRNRAHALKLKQDLKVTNSLKYDKIILYLFLLL